MGCTHTQQKDPEGSSAMTDAETTLRVVIAGGGSGGHLYPGIAIAEAFLEAIPEARIRFIGAHTGIEARVLPREGWDVHLIDASRLRGGGVGVAMKGLLRMPGGIASCVGVMREFRPHLVIGVGGYASGAAMLAASLCGVPAVVQEQNAIPGMTNRVASSLSARVYTSFESAGAHFGGEKVRLLGNPIRARIRESLSQATRRRGLGEAEGPLHVLVFGGSQGARFLNENVPDVLAHVIASGAALEVVHQTGTDDVDATRERYAALGVEAEVMAYIDDMSQRYRWADVAICRSGASTVAELTTVGLPAVLVPFPLAAHDHQTANGRAVVEADGAIMIRQEEWHVETVAGELLSFARDRERLAKMAERSRAMGRPDAAAAIVRDCLALLNERDLFPGGAS